MSSTLDPSDTIERLRARAASKIGDVFVQLEQLRDRPDLAVAATELIRHGNEMERAVAVLALRVAADRGAEVAQPVILALADPTPRVRITAARALGAIGWAGARPALEAATRDGDALVREHALLGLLELDAAAGVRRIGEALAGDREAREPALAALKQAKADNLPDELSALVDDPDLSTRVRAIDIMAFSSSSSSAPLFRALHDASPEVRLAAVNALSRREQAPPLDALPALFSDPDPQVRQRAVHLIGSARGPRHPQSLDLLPRDLPPSAAASVAVLGGIAALPRLRAMLAASTSVFDRQRVWGAIGRLAEPVPDGTVGAALLREGLDDPDVLVRCAAMRAAVWLGPLAATVVTERLRHESERPVRVAGVRALPKLLGSSAAPELRQALDDEYEDVRCAALESLGRVGNADDLAAVEHMVARSPLEQLARWEALVRLSHGEDALPESSRVLADPAHSGQLVTHWYEPVGDLFVKFSRAGTMIVFSDDDRIGEVGSFEVMADGHARINDRHCTLRVERVRIHEPISSSWGFSVVMKPDPWSSEPQRVFETTTWRND